MEDMCQLTGRLTEDKYKGSYEQIAKTILKYAANPGLDKVNFYEQVVFSFLTGNADMHLKNFSLIMRPDTGYALAPAYDMVASALLMKDDNEDVALTLNSKKRKLSRTDFDKVMASPVAGEHKTMERIYNKFTTAIPSWLSIIDMSFLPAHLKDEYRLLINERGIRLGIL